MGRWVLIYYIYWQINCFPKTLLYLPVLPILIRKYIGQFPISVFGSAPNHGSVYHLVFTNQHHTDIHTVLTVVWGRWYWRNHIRGPQDLIAVTFLRCVLSQKFIFSYNIFGLPCTQWRSLTMWWVLAAILVGSNARVNNNNNDRERERREKSYLKGCFHDKWPR